MRDYAKTLESNGSSVMEKIVPLRLEEDSNLEWKALQLMEEAAGQMRLRLVAHLPPEFTDNVKQVQMDHFGTLEKVEKLFLKCQIYGMSSSELMIKVFVHQIAGSGKTAKLARAVYHVDLQRVSVEAVA